MAEIQYAGEYELEEIRLLSSSGNIIPLNGLMVSLDLFENIFSPSMSGSITILDTNSIVLNMPVIGQEYLSFKIKTASLRGGETNIRHIYTFSFSLSGTGAVSGSGTGTASIRSKRNS